jgi:hypothetical protein
MTVSELAGPLLVKLYDYAEKHGYAKIVPVEKLAVQLGETGLRKIRNAAIAFKNRGLIDARISFNQSLGFISGEGAMLVERGGETGIITKYRENPASVIFNISSSANIHGNISHSNIAAHSIDSSQTLDVPSDIQNLLEKIEQQLTIDKSSNQEQLIDAFQDIETLCLQLGKSIRDDSILRSLLSNLSNVSSIGSFITELSQLIFR